MESCLCQVALSMMLGLSKPQFPHLQNRVAKMHLTS